MIVLAPFLLAFLVTDIIRLKNTRLNTKFIGMFSAFMREYEKRQLNASTYFLISSFISILLFPKGIAVVVLCFLTFGDTMASLIGGLFGRITIFNKTLEGSLACFVTCFVVAFFFFDAHVAVVGALVATLTELLPLKISDNLLIPIISGLSMMVIA